MSFPAVLPSAAEDSSTSRMSSVTWNNKPIASPKRRRRAASSLPAPAQTAPETTAARIVVVEGRQIVVNERIRMNEFERARRMQNGCHIRGENASRFQTQYRPDALASGKNAVAHRLMNRRRRLGFRRQQPLERFLDEQPVLFKKCGKFHRVGIAPRIDRKSVV